MSVPGIVQEDAAPASAASDLRLLLAARALRCFGDGFVSLLLPLHLLAMGCTPAQVGLIATVTLFGAGLLTLAVGARAGLNSLRALLLAGAALMALTGGVLATATVFWPLLLIALVGTINTSGGDIGMFQPLEHAVLARSVQERERTSAFARYSLVGTLAMALGALAAGLPAWAAKSAGVTLAQAVQAMFVLYALLACAAALLYRRLPRERVPAGPAAPPAGLGPSRRRVYLLAALFSLDGFGGGFALQTLLALWLFQRFGLALETAGSLFFWTGVLTAFSFLVAARLARRFGLVRTMVFTHIPSNLCLIAVPFCTELSWAIALLLVRSALAQMDAPPRSAYVMAIVTPPERAAAVSVTSVPRGLAVACSPVLAGWMLGLSAFGWHLVLGGAVKLVYDFLLLAMFSRVRPLSEQEEVKEEKEPWSG